MKSSQTRGCQGYPIVMMNQSIDHFHGHMEHGFGVAGMEDGSNWDAVSIGKWWVKRTFGRCGCRGGCCVVHLYEQNSASSAVYFRIGEMVPARRWQRVEWVERTLFEV